MSPTPSPSPSPPLDADAFAFSEALIASPAHKPAGTLELDFDGLLSPPPRPAAATPDIDKQDERSPLVLRLHEDLASGNGGQAWPAGMILAKYLLRRKRVELRDKQIVELGAGGGLCGLAVTLGCTPTHPVYITDQAAMVPLMQHNIALNALNSTHIRATEYDWGAPRPAAIPVDADVILAADCVYFEPAFPLLLRTLAELLARPQAVCYFCFKRRRRADVHFIKAARKMFVVEDVRDDPDREGYARENIFLCTLRQKPSSASHNIAQPV